MNYYNYLYIVSVTISVLGWVMMWRQQKNMSGFFFLLFTIFSSLWFVIYYLFFSWLFIWDELLMLSRLGFWSGIPTVYSLLLYLIYYWDNDTSWLNFKKIALPFFVFFSLFCLYVGTDWIIYDLEFSFIDNVSRELTWSYFLLHIILHISFFLLFWYFSFKKVQTQDNLNKIRLKNILLSTFTLLVLLITLQLILPYFWIWILEKEIIFIFTLYVVSVPIIVRRYYFSHIWYGIWKVIMFLAALAIWLIITYAVRYFIVHIGNTSLSYWVGKNDYWIFDTFLTIIVYFPVYTFLQKYFLWNISFVNIGQHIDALKKKISQITDPEELNQVLNEDMYKLFKCYSASIYLYSSDEHKTSELRKFFFDEELQRIFINDIVYIEQNKKFFNIEAIRKDIPKATFLLFPLYSTSGVNIGYFTIWHKRFGDFYALEEVNILKEFSFFLQIHLKYIRTYTTMQDLSLNLDRKVDEKTIEYNDLINKQKEFISIISHEIKSPIASAIFQSDSIIDDINNDSITLPKIKDELHILNDQLLRSSGIIAKVFSVQYYDTHAVHLFRENIQFSHFLESELELFAHVHPELTLISNIAANIWFVSLDKIQFQQVLSNLLDNALKFMQPMEDPIIAIHVTKKQDILKIIIEDSGKGFEGIEAWDVFDKYKIGKKWMVWLWMWLYLCKKIISMHKGTIEADNSTKYGGAKFTMTLPIK